MEHVGLTLNMTNSVGLCPQFWPIELKRTYGTQLPKTHYYAHEPLKSVWLGLWVQGSESTISTNNSNSRRALSTLRVGKWIFDDFRWFFCRIRRWHFVCSMLHFSGKKCVLFFPQETTNPNQPMTSYAAAAHRIPSARMSSELPSVRGYPSWRKKTMRCVRPGCELANYQCAFSKQREHTPCSSFSRRTSSSKAIWTIFGVFIQDYTLRYSNMAMETIEHADFLLPG